MKMNRTSPLLTRTSLMVMMAVLFALAAVQPAFASRSSQEASAWYVSTTGSDTNDCLTTTTPCASINAALTKAAAGETIKVAVGVYTAASGFEVVLVNKSINFSGGWDEAFSTQTGFSTLDGQNARRGITVEASINVLVDHFEILNGYHTSQGGGIRNNGNLTINHSLIRNNTSEWMGGGIFTIGDGTTLTLNDTVIRDNHAGHVTYSGGGGGAGIQVYSGTAILNNSAVVTNSILGGFSGSGIYVTGTLVVNNTTISGNTGGDGTGISSFVATISLNNATITANQTYGFFNQQSSFTLQNTLISGNNGSSDCYNNTSGYSGTVVSHGYNLVGRNNNCTITATTGDKFGTIASPINARLMPLANNGGPSPTHALIYDSPALNAGNPSTPGSLAESCLLADQRGITRPVGSACDIGAFEGSVNLVTSIVRADQNPTSALAVKFTVTFSDAVTGVDTAAPFNDFRLTTTGPNTSSIDSVVGSGSVYTVTVNTGLGADTVRLDVIDDDSILDSQGMPLGSLGAGNGNFTSGEVYTINQPRVVSIKRVDPNPASALAVKFSVTFSEAVTGVDKAAPFNDFAITTTGLNTTSIASVVGSGSVYTVTVNTGRGADTVRLDVNDNDSITNSLGRPLGGQGAGDGNFKAGETYTIKQPKVVSIKRASPNPTSAFSVNFTVLFSEPVSGVDKVAPFLDFALTKNIMKGGAISAVSGTGTTYTVTVNLGQLSENGNIRLDVIDNDTIRNALGRPLGGITLGDGNFKTGENYTLIRISTPQQPALPSVITTPVYLWSRVPSATQYNMQLWNGAGTTMLYQYNVLTANCGTGTSCRLAPTNILSLGNYKWRVRAMVSGVWMGFSPYKAFAVTGPLAGFWAGSWTNHYITASRNSVQSFAIYISVSGCGTYKITHLPLASIVNRKFSFTGSFFASGFVDSLTAMHGTAGLKSFYVSGCGNITGGPFNWTAVWQHADQAPAIMLENGPIVITEVEQTGKPEPGPFMVEKIAP